MKKSFLMLLLVLIPNLCFGAWYDGDRCLRKDKKMFYACRSEGFGTGNFCADAKAGLLDFKRNYSHGDTVVLNGTNYACCREGKLGFIATNKFWTSTVISKDNEPGTTINTNADGSVEYCRTVNRYSVCKPQSEGTPEFSYQICNTCKTPTVAYRNGECVEYCGQNDATMAFESDSSNTCIQCETNRYQGIKIDDLGYNVCQKCNPATQFWSEATGDCVNKSELKQSNKNELRSCWTAGSSIEYKCCLKYGEKALNDYKIDENKITDFKCCLEGSYKDGDICAENNGGDENNNGSRIIEIITDRLMGLFTI